MTAYANNRKHFRYATESTFGSPGADGIPDITGLTLIAALVEHESVSRAEGLTLIDDTAVRTGFAPAPGEPDSVWSVTDSKYLDRGGGEISCTVKVRNFGTGDGASITEPVRLLVAAALATILHASKASTSTVTVAGAGSGAAQAELGAALDPGEMVMVTQGGKALANRCTDWNAGTDIATFLQAFPSALATSSTIVRGLTLHAATGAHLHSKGPSLALEVAAPSGKTVATGCRATTVALSLDAAWLMAEITFSCAYMTQVDGPITIVQPAPLAGSYTPKARLACARVGSVVTPAGAPASVGAADLVYLGASWGLTVTAELSPVSEGASCDVIGMADMEVTSLRAELSFDTNDINTSIPDDFLERGQRSYIFPFGPVAEGNGIAVCLPAAHFTANPRLHDIGGPLAVQPWRMVAGPYQGDDATAAADVNSDFSIFFAGIEAP